MAVSDTPSSWAMANAARALRTLWRPGKFKVIGKGDLRLGRWAKKRVRNPSCAMSVARASQSSLVP